MKTKFVSREVCTRKRLTVSEGKVAAKACICVTAFTEAEVGQACVGV